MVERAVQFFHRKNSTVLSHRRYTRRRLWFYKVGQLVLGTEFINVLGERSIKIRPHPVRQYERVHQTVEPTRPGRLSPDIDVDARIARDHNRW